MKKQYYFLLAAVFLISAYAAYRLNPSAPARDKAVSYSRDVRPILDSRCLQCHSERIANRGLNMESYESLMAGSQNGPVILPGNPRGSLLVKKLVGGEMPKRGPRLTPDQIRLIDDWIAAGAPNN
jgi:mono/diheme cytochrome c family protein